MTGNRRLYGVGLAGAAGLHHYLRCIVLAVAVVALVIGQSAVLFHHDYDIFLSRGRMPMTAVCFLFMLACGVLMAVGSTVLGIAITDLHACGTTGTVHRVA
jgi:uncharacterized membrane protein YoaK (UPF0700 family)